MEHCSKCGKALPKIAGMYIFACYGYGDNITCDKCNSKIMEKAYAELDRQKKIREATPNNGCSVCGSQNAKSFDYDNALWFCERCYYVTKYGEEKWQEVLIEREKFNNEKTCGSIKLYMKEKQFEWLHRYNFDDVISYELIENGNIEKKGGLGTAIIGGAIAGAPGAIIGYSSGRKSKNICTDYKILIRMKGRAPLEIGYIGGGSGLAYDSSQFTRYRKDALATIEGIEIILSENEKNHETSVVVESISDEIMKLKKLLDSGIITESEFDKAKEKLLNT